MASTKQREDGSRLPGAQRGELSKTLKALVFRDKSVSCVDWVFYKLWLPGSRRIANPISGASKAPNHSGRRIFECNIRPERHLRQLSFTMHGLRPWTYHCLFGLLSVTGLRVSEAQNLELQDVDVRAGVLTIRGAKFGKSRLVPLHSSTRKVLAHYMARRERVWSNRPVSSYLFVSGWGNRLDGGEIRRTFYALSRQIGLRGPSDCHGPRLHDLRQNAESRKMPSDAA
jgi:integrase